MSLPTELFYTICRHVCSRKDLRSLASSSRTIQRPAEAALHNSIIISSRDHGRQIVCAARRYPRFTPLVKSLRLELDVEAILDMQDNYWGEIRMLLSAFEALEHLDIQDGLDKPLAWVLDGLRPGQLKSLQCTFVIDDELVRVLRSQTYIHDLTLKSSIIHLSLSSIASHALGLDSHANDIDEHVIHALRRHLDPLALPRLHCLHTESLALARALVPGRPVTHLWAPGASFSTSVTSSYLYRHIYGPQSRRTSTERSDNDSAGEPRAGDENRTLSLRQAGPQIHTSTKEHVAYLRTALDDFAKSTADIVSLRLALNLPFEGAQEVLTHISATLPTLRVLGFLPSCIVEQQRRQSHVFTFESVRAIVLIE